MTYPAEVWSANEIRCVVEAGDIIRDGVQGADRVTLLYLNSDKSFMAGRDYQVLFIPFFFFINPCLQDFHNSFFLVPCFALSLQFKMQMLSRSIIRFSLKLNLKEKETSVMWAS